MFMFKNKGISLVEVLIGVSLLLAISLGVFTAYSLFIKTIVSNTNVLYADLLLEEGAEIIRYKRDAGWTEFITPLSTGVDYGITQGVSDWSIGVGSTYSDGFERSFVLESVYRDTNDDIASTGTLDGNTYKVILSVSWDNRNATSTRNMSMYISNIFE